MGSVAAIFDLDRTVLVGPSGPLINEALLRTGLRSRKVPGEALLYRAYELFGEHPIGIALARAAVLGVKGWPLEALEDAGSKASVLLEEAVAPYARGVITKHRRAGHRLVLATTTPEHLVAPLARHLGFDDVVATRYASTGGVLTGALEGGFVWGQGKLAAVRDLLAGSDVEWADSFAYSDSIYDLPLLSAVGHPVATNPDAALHAVAILRRWQVMHLASPPGVPTLGGIEAFDVLRRVVRPELFPYARFRLEGVEQIPDSGPFILVANHRSYFDVAAIALLVAKKGRRTRFLGKKELFDAPVVGQIVRSLGGISVERSGPTSGVLVAAERVLEAGDGLVVMPQGTIPRGRALFDPVLRGKTGAARLAARTGAPVVTVGLWNTEAVWPRSARLPRVSNLLAPPVVLANVGPPVAGLGLRRDSAGSDTEVIMSAISALLPEEARAEREPTEEELARSYPAGRRGEERSLGIAPEATRTGSKSANDSASKPSRAS